MFARMPSSKVLTTAVDVPESWLVAAVEARYDLDNIRLEDLGEQPTLFATYELEALLVTGHCSELRARSPPRGVQVRFCRYRFCPTGELKYRGAVGLGYRSTYKRTFC